MQKIKKIIRIFRLILRINWFKTLYVNFKTQEFRDALKLPILVYGKLKIISLDGKINLSFPIRFGVIQINKDIDNISLSQLPTFLNITGNLNLNGPLIFSGGNTIICKNSFIDIGKFVVVASGVNIRAYKGISIGDYTRLASECFLMDTNVHFVKNNETGTVTNIYGKISIGKYCWLNSGTIVAKDTKLPDYSITARNSYLNKDYTLEVEKGPFLVGSPAKIKGTNVQRIYGYELEKQLKSQFLSDKDLLSICIDEVIETDEDFKPFFKVV